MLGLLLLYFLGKKFYELAHEYNRSRWGFAILGVASYYAGVFIAGVGFVLLGAYIGAFSNLPDIVISLLSIPFGLLAAWLLYRMLERSWINAQESTDSDVLDQNL
jgi:hypothetical protein